MIPADDLIAAARGMIGTPWVHQARQPGVGLDCIGLIVCALRACGATPPDRTDYSRTPSGLLLPLLGRHCGSPTAWAPGRLAVYRIMAEPQHLALIGGETIIHTSLETGRVVEHAEGARWARRRVAVYAIPGVSA